jgi:hypothetical protein
MYAVYIQQGPNQSQTMIHSPTVDELKIFETKIVKNVDAIDSFGFSIYPNNPAYNQLNYLTTLVEVWNEESQVQLFKGRVLEPSEEMDSEGKIMKEIVCEGELAYLHDSLQKWGKWQNMTPAQFFSALIAEHNSQVEPYKQFTVGNVDVTNTTDNVYRYTDDDADTYDTIKDKLIDRLGGELQIRYVEGVRYIDYLQQTGSVGTQRIELSVNLKSISRNIDPSELITVLKPLGNRLESEEENADASDPRLTIASVNDGSIYLRDESKIAQFGIRSAAVVWDDVTQAGILRTRGLQFLANQKTALVRYQIDTVDLAPLDLTVDSFRCGWTYPVFNPLMGIDEGLRVINQTIDINDPTGSVLGIGDKFLTQEQYNLMSVKQAKIAQGLENQIVAQGRSIGTLRTNLEDTEERLTILQNQVNNGTGEVQNQISAILDEMQLIIGDMQDIADSVPTAQTMQDIQTAISNLNDFMDAQILLNLNQADTNADFASRISALEPND